MPLVTIYAPPPVAPQSISKTISDIQKVGAAALNCGTENIWVVFQTFSSTSLSADFFDGTHGPVVIVKAQGGRPAEQREAFMKAMAKAIGEGLSYSPEKVWIHYQEMQPQDIWFGGWSNKSEGKKKATWRGRG